MPTPVIDVVYDENSLDVGISTALECTVEDYSIADSDVVVNVTWSISGTVLSNDSDVMIISNLNESLSTFVSQLTLSPLRVNDENITCSANTYLATPNPYIEMSPTVSKQVQLMVEGNIIL